MLLVALFALSPGQAQTPPEGSALSIDADFPAGNVVVDRIEGDDVFLRQDLRDTAGWWFYWHFRVRGAGGRTIRFHFTNKPAFGPQGPAYSLDGGATWAWLGPKRSNTGDPPPKDGFVFRFPAGAADARFCFAIPYVEPNLRQFLDRHRTSPPLKTGVLCKTAKGRSAEVLYLGRLDGQGEYRLAFTCRHHACESVASYVLEGLMDSILAETETGRWFRGNAAVVVIPFVDKDGVEAGDQGKNRKPHDHNRDYAGNSNYPTVAAIKKLLPEWSGGRLDVAVDLHCPSLGDSLIQFIGSPDQKIWPRTLKLSQCLESCQAGPLRHDAKRNVPFGTGWNKGTGLKSASFTAWASGLPTIHIATTIEVPYSQVGQTPVSATGARMLGRDLAEAIKNYLEKELPRRSDPTRGGDRPGITQGPLQVSGIYPHLAVFSDSGEVGIGAVVPWAGKLWMITYPPHAPHGSTDKLYEIDANMNVRTRPESVGGTHACRMIHRESNQLILGPYFIDDKGKVRAADLKKLAGRLTAVARHLTDPANKVYFFDMEGAIYEVDVHSLDVVRLFEKPVPGWHGKGGYTAQGRLVIANNGEAGVGSKNYKFLVDDVKNDPEAAGALAEWDGKTWRLVERRQFTDVTGPGGIYGSPDDKSPLWSIGWDRRSLILKLLDGGKWSTFRLPKASHAYDPRHGWYTEWPRIREVAPGKLMMTMHGMFFDFPAGFRTGRTGGLTPIASYLRYVPDFCEWNGRLVLASDDASRMQNPMVGQSQSSLWFGSLVALRTFGPRAGWGGSWRRDRVKGGEPSDPMLAGGFDRIVAHLTHDADVPVTFSLEADAAGDGLWKEYRKITVPARGYRPFIFPEDFRAQWIRFKTDRDCTATAYLHYASARDASHDNPAMFASLAKVTDQAAVTAGLIRPAKHNRNLQFLARPVDADGVLSPPAYYEVDERLDVKCLSRNVAQPPSAVRNSPTQPGATVPQVGSGIDAGKAEQDRTEEVQQVAAVKRDFQVDHASVIMVQDGKRYRLPKGNARYDRPFAAGWPRGIRECESERFLMNIHGTFYEMPRDHGLPLIKPVCSHGRQIMDYCTWRGLLTICGTLAPARPDGHCFASADHKVGLWFGSIDDLWRLGKPTGAGGPWADTAVVPGACSDPYLMTGFDRKRMTLRHDAKGPVQFTIEVDIDHAQWVVYATIAVPDGKCVEHAFAPGFNAHWLRVKVDKPCTATVRLTYE